MFPDERGHTWFAPVIEQEGKSLTVTVAVPDWARAQPCASNTLTNAYTKVPVVPVGTGNVTEFPEVVEIF